MVGNHAGLGLTQRQFHLIYVDLEAGPVYYIQIQQRGKQGEKGGIRAQSPPNVRA